MRHSGQFCVVPFVPSNMVEHSLLHILIEDCGMLKGAKIEESDTAIGAYKIEIWRLYFYLTCSGELVPSSIVESGKGNVVNGFFMCNQLRLLRPFHCQRLANQLICLKSRKAISKFWKLFSTSTFQTQQVVSMLQVATNVGSTSFQSKLVNGAAYMLDLTEFSSHSIVIDSLVGW